MAPLSYLRTILVSWHRNALCCSLKREAKNLQCSLIRGNIILIERTNNMWVRISFCHRKPCKDVHERPKYKWTSLLRFSSSIFWLLIIITAVVGWMVPNGRQLFLDYTPNGHENLNTMMLSLMIMIMMTILNGDIRDQLTVIQSFYYWRYVYFML